MRPSLNAFTFDIPPTLFLSLDAISKIYTLLDCFDWYLKKAKPLYSKFKLHTFLLLTLHNEIKSQLYSVKINR